MLGHVLGPVVGFSANQFMQLILGSVVAVLMLAVLLPFAASLLLDSVILIIRGRGFKGLAVAIVVTSVIATAGALALSAGGPQSSASFSISSGFLLPFSCALALIAFAVRQVKQAIARRAL